MAIEKEFNWNRYWCPSNGTYSLGEDGFLLDPESPSARYYKSTALKFDEIPDTPCLVLLGEPGIGKTKAMDDILKSYPVKEGEKIARIDLRPYITDDALVSDLEKQQKIIDWLSSDYRLILFFDSLDECLLNVKTVSTILLDRLLKRWPYSRLSLRFACRTADWPNLLDVELCSLYEMKELPKYELLPLTSRDVKIAALQEGIDPENFLRAVSEAEVSVFANRPVTLNFLLSSYKKNGSLPKRKSDIYWQGCLQLCEEKNKSRIASKQTGNLSTEQRLVVASRIAAIMMLSNKFAIWTGVDNGSIPSEDVLLRNLSGFKEKSGGNDFVVDETVVREALDTGLFSSLGNQRMGFSHHTYAEYLAAYYLNRPQIPADKLIDLVSHSDGKIIPQLYGLSTWLATISSGIFEKIVSIQPELALRVDGEVTTDAQKKTIVDALLNSYEAGELYDYFDLIKYLSRIRHKGISKQIIRIIKSKKKKRETRILAIFLARECKVIDVVDVLIPIILDSKEDFLIRKYSARTVESIADINGKSRLMPLIVDKQMFDFQNELKGITLQAVWPNQISIEDLLASLEPISDSSYFGTYRQFLSYDFVEGLKNSDLPFVLRWIIDNNTLDDSVIVQVMKKGWENLEDPEIKKIFVELADQRIRNHQENRSYEKDKSYLTEIINQTQKRRVLVMELIARMGNIEEAHYLFSTSPNLVMQDDIDWIITKIYLEEDVIKKQIMAQIFFLLLNRRNFVDVEKAYAIYENLPEVGFILAPLFAPVELNSDLASILRKRNALNREVEQRRSEEGIQPRDYQFEVLNYLEQFENGDIDAWWKLNLTFLSSEANYSYEFDADLTMFSLWEMIGDEVQLRLIDAAEKYLIRQEPSDIFKGDEKSIFRPSTSAFRAFYLLAVKAPSQLKTLPEFAWKKWASVLFSYPGVGNKYLLDIHQLLMFNLFDVDKKYFYEKLNEEINIERLSDYFPILKLIEDIDTDEIQSIMSSLLVSGVSSQYSYSELLKFLLTKNNLAAKEHAIRTTLMDVFDDSDKDKKFHSARSLIFYTSDAGWPTISNLLKSNDEFGQSLFLRLADGHDDLATNLVAKIPEHEISKLFIWLESRFPSKEDPAINQGRSIMSREQLGRFRDSLIRVLASKGSELACEAIEMLSKKYPEKEWLLQQFRLSQRNFRRNTWIPLEPYRVLEIVRDSYSEYIKSQRHALNIIFTILQFIFTTSILVLPILVDPDENSGIKFIASNKLPLIILLILSNLVLVLVNSNRPVSEN